MKNHERYAAEISAALANAADGPHGIQEMTLLTYLESGCVADFPDCETCPVHLQGVCPGYGSMVAPDPEEIAKWLNAEVAA